MLRFHRAALTACSRRVRLVDLGGIEPPSSPESELKFYMFTIFNSSLLLGQNR